MPILIKAGKLEGRRNKRRQCKYELKQKLSVHSRILSATKNAMKTQKQQEKGSKSFTYTILNKYKYETYKENEVNGSKFKQLCSYNEIVFFPYYSKFYDIVNFSL